MALASEAHADQKYGERPYFAHLYEVTEALRLFGYADPFWSVCGWLHDSLEDTSLSPEQIEQEFGPEVRKYVSAVSGFIQSEGRSRPSRKEMQQNIALQIAEFPNAIPIKLADRICNVRHCWETRSRKLFMYHSEYSKFRVRFRNVRPEFCGVVGGLEMMWRELDRLHGRD